MLKILTKNAQISYQKKKVKYTKIKYQNVHVFNLYHPCITLLWRRMHKTRRLSVAPFQHKIPLPPSLNLAASATVVGDLNPVFLDDKSYKALKMSCNFY
jgi:hypothetical protein